MRRRWKIRFSAKEEKISNVKEKFLKENQSYKMKVMYLIYSLYVFIDLLGQTAFILRGDSVKTEKRV